MNTRVCTNCKQEKSITEYYCYSGKFIARCKSCYSKLKNKVRVSRYNLHYKWGFTPEMYDELVAKQNGLCEICGVHFSKLSKRLAIDHDHKTGKIRGVLCSPCNRGIGLLQDSPAFLRKAAQYLEKNF